MSSYSDQIEQIKTLLASSTKSEKSCGYSMLLHLQQQSTQDDMLLQLFVNSAQALLSSVVNDIIDDDEEISAQALKCMGFMIYCPQIVHATPRDTAGILVETLCTLVTTTKVKTICNLGIWCISMQNLDASVLTDHFSALLRAILHSLDNPIGSLSTTFEATQAVMKMTGQMNDKMRDTSSSWVPPIYRRLLSADKRERDMCQRCLLRIESTVFPPPCALSAAVVRDIKTKLLPGMKELLKHGKKVQVLQGWRWYIRLLGSHSLKHRHLVNEMLKVTEVTFADQDPQVQIASQVAWEGLIDALIYLPLQALSRKRIHKQKNPEDNETLGASSNATETNLFMRSLKLIMTPLKETMSCECDISVKSSCFNNWCHLLEKLQLHVNDPRVFCLAVEPFFKVVFQLEPNDSNFCFWEYCIDLLIEFVQAKSASKQNFEARYQTRECQLKKRCSVQWLSWDCSQLSFIFGVIHSILHQASGDKASFETRKIAGDGANRIFRSLLKGVLMDLAHVSTSHSDRVQSLKALTMFVRGVSEPVFVEDHINIHLLLNFLKLLNSIVDEIEPSWLSSPHYKVALELHRVPRSQFFEEVKLKEDFCGESVLTDMVPPITYFTIMYFSVLIRALSKGYYPESISVEVCVYLKLLLSSYDNSWEILRVVVSLLYSYSDRSGLRLWALLAQGLEESSANRPFMFLSGEAGRLTLCHLLVYPFILCSSDKTCSEGICSNKLTPKEVSVSWRSLYYCISSCDQRDMNHISKDLCTLLNRFLDLGVTINRFAAGPFSTDQILSTSSYPLCAEVASCVLENLPIEKVDSDNIDLGSECSGGISCCLEFVSRLLRLVSSTEKSEPLATFDLVFRLFHSLIHFVRRLQLKNDILHFSKIVCDALLPWISEAGDSYPDNVNSNLQLLWAEILKCLQKSCRPSIFNASSFEFLVPVFEKTLVHPIPSISKPTITFWNSTYGKQMNLEGFPPNFVSVVNKLWRDGKIITNESCSLGTIYNGLRKPEQCFLALRNSKVVSTANINSKRVELRGEDGSNGPFKKRRELTEHQKEVRRAQQGRERDCNGHGPGIRTYTNADFSQGKEYEDSEEASQEIRNPELILDLLKRNGGCS